MTPIIRARIQPYQKTAAALATENDIPLQGERVRATDTGREKTGDGTTHYNDLDYDDDPAKLDGVTESGLAVLTGSPEDGRDALGAINGEDVAPAVLADATLTQTVTPEFTGPALQRNPPISRAGSFAGLGRWLRSTVGNPASGTAGLTIVTDSTGIPPVDGQGWPEVLAGMIADAYPNLTVRLRQFDPFGTLKMDPPEVIQESSLGRPYYAIGTSNGAYLTCPYGVNGLLSAHDLLVDDDLDLRMKFSAKHTDIDGLLVRLLTNYGPSTGASDRGIEWYINTDGTLALRVAISTSGWNTFNSTVALSFTDDVPIWIRAVLDRDNGSSQKVTTFYYSADDQATWTQLGSVVTVSTALTGAMVNDCPTWHWEIGTQASGLQYTLIPGGSAYTLSFYPNNAEYYPDLNYTTASIAAGADNATIQAAITALAHPALATAVVTGTSTKTVTFSKVVRYGKPTGGGTVFGPIPNLRKFRVFEVEIRKGIDGPPVGPTNAWDWEVSPSRVGYGGGPMLDIVNFAFSGRSIQNFSKSPYFEDSAQNRSTLAVILATSHNETQGKAWEFTALLDTWRTKILDRLPGATIAVGTHNPEPVASGNSDFQSARSAQLAAWAARNGHTVVDTFTAYLEDPRWDGVAGGALMADVLHPRALGAGTVTAPMYFYAITTGS